MFVKLYHIVIIKFETYKYILKIILNMFFLLFINKTAKMKVKRKSTPNKIIKLDKVKVMKIFRMFCIEMKHLIVTLHAKYGCKYKKAKFKS